MFPFCQQKNRTGNDVLYPEHFMKLDGEFFIYPYGDKLS
jgi:hypothetical protein